MKTMKVALVIIVVLVLSTACTGKESKIDELDDTTSKNEVEVEVERGDWKSDLLWSSKILSFPLPSRIERAMLSFEDSVYSKEHELTAVAHMSDNQILLSSSSIDEENLNGWIYNDVSGKLIESQWDENDVKRVAESDKEFVLNNILYPYNHQNINNIKNVTTYLDSELKKYVLGYFAAYNDYYVLVAFEDTGVPKYIALLLYIDYQGNLIEVEKYLYDENATSPYKFIEYTELTTESKDRLTRNQALGILKPHVNLIEGQDFGDGSIREIDGEEYYLFTIFNEYSVDEAYCVDVLTGDLYSCDEELTLKPLE